MRAERDKARAARINDNAQALIEKLRTQNEKLKTMISPYRLAIEHMRTLGYTEEEIESITLGHKALRNQFAPPEELRTLRQFIKDGVSPEDLIDGSKAYKVVAAVEDISEREAYGWLLGYPPDFGVVN